MCYSSELVLRMLVCYRSEVVLHITLYCRSELVLHLIVRRLGYMSMRISEGGCAAKYRSELCMRLQKLYKPPSFLLRLTSRQTDRQTDRKTDRQPIGQEKAVYGAFEKPCRAHRGLVQCTAPPP